jgi:hypothetical protein
MYVNNRSGVVNAWLFKHSTNTISPTDAKLSNGMDNKAQLTSPGVLVSFGFQIVVVDYCDEYEMMSIETSDLVNRSIA